MTKTEEPKYIKQKTIRTSIFCVGVGLHSGKKVKLTLKPAPEDTGIIFRRTDIDGGGASIEGSFRYVADTRLCTCISDTSAHTVATIEHLMAAVHGLGITNLEVQVSGAEMPLLDGSAKDFVFLLSLVGIQEQAAVAKVLKIKKAVTVKDKDNKDSFITLMPADSGFTIDFFLDYSVCPFIGKQSYLFNFTTDNFIKEIAPARTFGLAKEIEQIRAMGLAKGGSLENVVIATDNDVLNPEGLRFRDEFVRHKILDAMGDMYTSGYTIQGKMIASKSGHKLNNMLLCELFKNPAAFEIIDAVYKPTRLKKEIGSKEISENQAIA